jgi:hypothetical protein
MMASAVRVPIYTHICGQPRRHHTCLRQQCKGQPHPNQAY